MFKEFKEFAMKGNVVDMAIGVIIGGAFGKIVASLVKDVIMPPIGYMMGGVNFDNLFITLNGKSYASLAEATAAGAPVISYGVFINTIVDFLIIALALFFVIKGINNLKKEEAPAEVTTKECPFCKTEIHKDATRCPNCTSELAD